MGTKRYTYIAYLGGALVCIFSMSISPYFPPRATFAPFVFLVIVTGLLLFQNIGLVWKKTLYRCCIVFLAAVLFIYTFMVAVNDLSQLNHSLKDRITHISQIDNQGEAEYELKDFVLAILHNNAYSY